MSLADLFYATPFYRACLWGPTPRRLAQLPPPAPPGNAARGKAILDGTLPVASGRSLPMEGAFSPNANASAADGAELHGFAWLDDLAATTSSQAGETARRLIAEWIEANPGWQPIAWAPAVLGQRLANWLTHATLIARGEADPLGPRILRSMARQARHLARVARGGPAGVERFLALRGLIYALACGVGPRSRLESAVRWLLRELQGQILPDGGHISRSPAEQLRALSTLIDIRVMLVRAGHAGAPELVSSIRRMAAMTRFYRLGDGRLTLQNGSAEGDRATIDAVLNRADTADDVPASAADSGFERLVAGQTVIILDCGAPPTRDVNPIGHAGTLSFEMSCGTDRLIVNCGAFATSEPAWVLAQRSTAAHSTVTIDDTNSSPLAGNGAVGRYATIVERVRDTSDGNTWIAAAHDGYQSGFGLIHRRRLYLAQDGDDLRGEDTVSGTHRGQCVARFHLHPDVSASLVQNGAAILLRLPSGTAWRFQAAGGALDLSESIYFGAGGKRRTEQITVSAPLQGEDVQVRWALKRLSA